MRSVLPIDLTLRLPGWSRASLFFYSQPIISSLSAAATHKFHQVEERDKWLPGWEQSTWVYGQPLPTSPSSPRAPCWSLLGAVRTHTHTLSTGHFNAVFNHPEERK